MLTKIISVRISSDKAEFTDSYQGLNVYLTSNLIEVNRFSRDALPADVVVMPREISTQNFRSLFNTSAEVMGSMEAARRMILSDIDLSQYYLESGQPDLVDQLSFHHLLSEDYWISNTLSSMIFSRAEEVLMDTVLGKNGDPLFEAGKLFGLTFAKWKMAALQFMSIRHVMQYGRQRNEGYNRITNIEIFERKGATVIEYTYLEGITPAINGKPIAKEVCNWNRGVFYYFIKMLSYADIKIEETSCVADGDPKCVFVINHKSKGIRHRLRSIINTYLNQGLIDDHERVVREYQILKYNMQKIIDTQKAELENLTNTDPLTGIKNRRYFESQLQQYTKMSQRTGKKLVVIMIDIDHFKKINDTYGHQCGDRCLQLVAATISESVQRDSDFTARYGGEEFAIVLLATDRRGGLKVAERIRKAVQQMEIPITEDGSMIRLTISAGIGEGNLDGYEIVAAADKALYVAKQNGRNRVEIMAVDK